MKNKLFWWKYKTSQWWNTRLPYWIARHLPDRVVYWCAIRVGSRATTGKHESQIVPDLLFMEALNRWEEGVINGTD